MTLKRCLYIHGASTIKLKYLWDANARTAMKELHEAISKHQTVYPEAAFIVMGDFIHSYFRTEFPKFQ